nr:class I SAM-dependent methyltransferase [uncultured Marinifilum sp.]
MNFYQSISTYYEYIFPLNKIQLEFIQKSHSKSASELSVLDIGCATGNLSVELAKNYKKVVGIDLDKAMVKRAMAKANAKNNLEYKFENMLNIDSSFGKSHFDIIACFGNTLVHLESEEMVADFFKKAQMVLKSSGKLLFQIINYDRIIDQNITSLPSIENKTIKFERNYNYLQEENKVEFETILTIKESQNKISNCIPLLALRKQTIEKLLLESGFSNVKFYGNFKRDKLTENSVPLIVEAGF